MTLQISGLQSGVKMAYAGNDIPLTDAQHAGLIEPVADDRAYADCNGIRQYPGIGTSSICPDQASGAEIFEPRTVGQCRVGKLGAKHGSQNVRLKRGLMRFAKSVRRNLPVSRRVLAGAQTAAVRYGGLTSTNNIVLQ